MGKTIPPTAKWDAAFLVAFLGVTEDIAENR
jgi:hypothetical protein